MTPVLSLMQSAPEISTKPLARALRKFAAQRDYLTISLSQARSRQNAHYCVFLLHVLLPSLTRHGACSRL